jgi:DNA polymerase elongation subunit (family B)
LCIQQLSKDPKDYSDVKSLPHVQIAVRFNTTSTGRKMKRGDTIAYIVCEVCLSPKSLEINKSNSL